MRNVVFSKRASVRLENLLDYLESEWSVSVKKNFINKLDRSISQIKKFPDSCPQSDIKKGLHILRVTSQTTLYYQYDATSIRIITIFDNRMNPEKLKEALR